MPVQFNFLKLQNAKNCVNEGWGKKGSKCNLWMPQLVLVRDQRVKGLSYCRYQQNIEQPINKIKYDALFPKSNRKLILIFSQENFNLNQMHIGHKIHTNYFLLSQIIMG